MKIDLGASQVLCADTSVSSSDEGNAEQHR